MQIVPRGVRGADNSGDLEIKSKGWHLVRRGPPPGRWSALQQDGEGCGSIRMTCKG